MNVKLDTTASRSSMMDGSLLVAHPLTGVGGWALNDTMLLDHLQGADIYEEQDCGQVVAISGWLSPRYGLNDTGGGHAFLCLKAKGGSRAEKIRHTLFVPTADLNNRVQVEFYAVDTNGLPLAADD